MGCLCFVSNLSPNLWLTHSLVWRLLLGLDLVLTIATLYARLTMRETEPCKNYMATETSLASGGRRGLKDQFGDFKVYFSECKHAKVLLATCACWFLL